MEFLELLPAPYALPRLWNEKSLALGLLGLCVPQLGVVQVAVTHSASKRTTATFGENRNRSRWK